MRPSRHNLALLLAVIGITLGFAWYVSLRPMDFRVYYHGAAGVFDGTRPVYGTRSGLGWPMHYRYPPLFLFIARPFTALPLSWAAALWTALRCAALVLVIRALWKRLGPARSPAAWLIPLFLAGPYVVEDIRYGNAQTFVFALTAASLLINPAFVVLAAAALSLAIVIKVWPLYFLPIFVIRRQWKLVGYTLVFSAVLLLLPALYFGFAGNLDLLVQWFRQEFSTQTGQAEIWFPSQSLRGVLMRYLTVIDYSQVPDSRYALVHVAAISPATVLLLWMALAGLLYAGLLAIAAERKIRSRVFGLVEAIAFAGLILLQPFSQKYTLVVLLWPAMVAARLVEGNRARILLLAAALIAVIQPLVYGAAAQRLLQVLGLDFLVTALLAAFLVVSTLRRTNSRSYSG